MYVASAAYATNAGTASTAVNALKLGGYEASEYLRKDEVQTLTAAYQEIEWTTPGIYNWVVPEGVNSILVTTVGGGGGCGYCRARTPYDYYGNSAYYHMFSGGGGGEVTPNVVVKVTPGETLQIVVGAGGRNAVTAEDMSGVNPLGGHISPTVSDLRANTNGGDGGRSYIARNGAAIAGTNANGGGGGKGSYYYSGTDNIGRIIYYTVVGKAGGKNSTDGHGVYFFVLQDTWYGIGINIDGISIGYKGSVSGNSNTSSSVAYGTVNANGEPVMHGVYFGGGGGASWGDGSGDGKMGGTGSGGGFYSTWYPLLPGDGMVKILAIGLTSD